MLSIGDFARLGRVSPRMLRHYDELGLLRPDRVDPTTGYRSYRVAQLARLHRLLALRDLGLSLEQIGEVLVDDPPLDELRGMLRIRRTQIAQGLAEVASVVHQGSMETVEPACLALVTWIEDSGYQLAGRSRELYLEWVEADWSKNVTELQMPVSR